MIRLMSDRTTNVEPRWPVLLALASVVGVHFSLPEVLSLGPIWLLVGAFVVLATFVSVLHSRGAAKKAYAVGLMLMISVTAAVVESHLLQSAASLWICNVLVFAAWYWKLDAGGPYVREKFRRHEDGAFLFPQMAI